MSAQQAEGWFSPLLLTVSCGSIEALRCLISHGAHANFWTGGKVRCVWLFAWLRTRCWVRCEVDVLMWFRVSCAGAIWGYQHGHGMNPLLASIQRNVPDFAAELLKANPASVNELAQTEGTYPLHAAIEKASPSMMSLLLDAGADPHLKKVSARF